MDFTAIAQLISNFGFPIVLVLGMGWFIYQLQKQSVDRETLLYNIIEKYSDKMEKITNTLEKVVLKLDLLSTEVAELKRNRDEDET
jgi:hypothetical protein